MENALVWFLSPRNSLGPAVALAVAGAVYWFAYGRRRRMIWPAIILAGLAVGSASWRLSVIWIPVSLDVEFAVTVYLWCPEEGVPEPKSARMNDEGFKRLFSRVRVIPGASKVLPRWWIRFTKEDRSVTFRVTESGLIARDIPASSIQDVYEPLEPGLRDLIRLNLQHIRDRTK
jgi:hypothetical protein